MTIQLSTPLNQVPGIGAIHQKRLEKLEIRTVKDLLFHFPRRYEDVSRVVPIAQLKQDELVSVHGIISSIKVRRRWRGGGFITEAMVEDDTGKINVIWFNQPYLTRTLAKGTKIALAGKPILDAKGKELSFMSPEFEVMRPQLLHTSRIVPVYPETRGISSKWLRWKIHSFLPLVIDSIQEELPQELVGRLDFMPKRRALWVIHFPAFFEEAKKARTRFSFADILKIRLKVLLERESRKREKGIMIPFDKEFIQRLVKGFSFPLTQDQRKAAWEVIQDMEKPYPMQRLLEGDVGTGKTLVALVASASVAHEGKQAVLMAPTEILASQHFETFVSLLSKWEMSVGLFTRSIIKMYDPRVEHVRKFSPTDMRKKIANGEIKIVIGTHTLINSKLKTQNSKEMFRVSGFTFHDLALVVIDEQHRFGVEQRSHLVNASGSRPHLLTMSATPIPRSLALTLYGDLSMSLLKIFPKGKRKIVTRIVTPLKRATAYEFIRGKLTQGNQAYVICPVIEESEKLDTKAAIEEYERLRKKIFPEWKVGLLHGRMKSKEKEETMQEFFEGKTNVLVATSVVEVGVDVAGASIMIVEGAERFGLSQIHQLRGRIGRRGQVGYCLLFTNSQARATWARLRALTESNDGFYLAEKDLEIRGPGQLLGIRQAGISDIAMEALGSSKLIEAVKGEADELVAKSPDLSAWPLLQKEVKEVYGKVHLE